MTFSVKKATRMGGPMAMRGKKKRSKVGWKGLSLRVSSCLRLFRSVMAMMGKLALLCRDGGRGARIR